MEWYQTFFRHNRRWSFVELICFLILLCIAARISFILLKKNKILLSQSISALMLLSLIMIILEATVFTRPSTGMHKYELRLFWSWAKVFKGNYIIAIEIVINILLLVPIGVLIPIVFHKKLEWWKGLIIGLIISCVIEVGQLVFCRGLFEWDDMIHNSVGCMLGCILTEKYLKLKNNNKK